MRGEITKIFGENVFSREKMKKYLSKEAYEKLLEKIEKNEEIDLELANEVATAISEWAISKGTTHYTHWFQPMTGQTAEKHESFIGFDNALNPIEKFSGKELVKGEPDASSFPSGGLRSTFEARGYTVWDPTSPVFIKYVNGYSTLCIPTAFFSYSGESLDKKIPFLRSQKQLSKAVRRILILLGEDVPERDAKMTLGAEQEYFLIDKTYYVKRPDLVLTGRTLFGRRSPKHQQMEDHYFGSIKPRILKFMEEVSRECWKLGIPAKTRHNEVAPAQFEIAPVFEEQNLAVDHNMMLMQILKEVAEKHGLVCLLHEKPFAGINGSGKHNNWSIIDPRGRNLFDPGNNPHENAVFLTFVCALIMGIDKHGKILRASIASAGNDHRLGANEAPPAIMSIYLGEQLYEVLEAIAYNKKVDGNGKKEYFDLGIALLPKLPKDITDRNRTSPIAFTGNKFEFRAVGSSQNCSTPNMVLNTIMADSLNAIAEMLEKELAKGTKINAALKKVLGEVIRKHKRVLFNGDNYSEDWKREAEKRGLPNIKNTREALEVLREEETIAFFERNQVLSRSELLARYHIYKEKYAKTIDFESRTALEMAKTMILPSSIRYLDMLCEMQGSIEAYWLKKQIRKINGLLNKLNNQIELLEKKIEQKDTPGCIDAMEKLREVADELEGEIDEKMWPLPKYRDMLFIY